MNKEALQTLMGFHKKERTGENLRASPFKKDLSNGIIFRQIHLYGQ